MFISLNTPDEVFQDIVDEALELTISDLSQASADGDNTYPALLPHISEHFDARTALDLLHSLKRCNLAPEWYLLQSPHRVATSDIIHRYCDLYNQRPHGTRVHANYDLHRLEWVPMLRLFIGEPYQDGAYVAPADRNALALRPLDDSGQQPVIRADQSPFYRRGVPTYPAPRDTA